MLHPSAVTLVLSGSEVVRFISCDGCGLCAEYLYIGLAVLSAIITLFLVKPLDHDGMAKEDAEVHYPSYPLPF